MTVRAFSIVVIRVTFVELTTSVCLARTLVFAHRTLNFAQVDLLVGFLDERLQVAKCSRAHVEAHGVRLRVRDAKCSVRELFVPFAGNHASARVRIGALSTNLHARVGGVTAAVAAVAAVAAAVAAVAGGAVAAVAADDAATAADAAVAAFAAVAADAAVAAFAAVAAVAAVAATAAVAAVAAVHASQGVFAASVDFR